MKRIIWIVLDSVGIGAMPDAMTYGDKDVNTFGHVYHKLGGLEIPHLKQLGFGNIDGVEIGDAGQAGTGTVARLAERSKGKDTTTGHWEMVGVYTEVPFPTYPNGFPKDLMDEFEQQIGRKSIGNYPASGTAILDELGEEHMRTGCPIVYTSADSVFQIAAHEEIIPLEELYHMCEVARKLLVGSHEVARVIARPFVGTGKGAFARTPHRRDFAVTPPKQNLLTYAKEKGLEVVGVGKIEDIFAGEGITEAIHTKDNMDGIDQTLAYMDRVQEGIIFTNLVDFDMKWGHRNDYESYGRGIEAFDKRLPEILAKMQDEDVLFITADHGCDPTAPGTDHTREYVPFIAYGKQVKPGGNLGTRASFADMGQTIADLFDLPALPIGESFKNQLFS